MKAGERDGERCREGRHERQDPLWVICAFRHSPAFTKIRAEEAEDDVRDMKDQLPFDLIPVHVHRFLSCSLLRTF